MLWDQGINCEDHSLFFYFIVEFSYHTCPGFVLLNDMHLCVTKTLLVEENASFQMLSFFPWWIGLSMDLKPVGIKWDMCNLWPINNLLMLWEPQGFWLCHLSGLLSSSSLYFAVRRRYKSALHVFALEQNAWPGQSVRPPELLLCLKILVTSYCISSWWISL